jgi:amino acid adenylation domain-containing protein
LDSSYPKERLAFMLDDSQAAVLIAQSFLIEKLPADKTTVLCFDREGPQISTESRDNPPPLSTPDNLAYVIYTSGSTGAPKGALIPHHNVVRLFRATGSWFRFGPADVWTLFHSYAFDFSVWEIWGALLHGGRLVVVPFEVSRSPQEFYQLLCREQVTVLNQTPSAFRQLVQAEESIDFSRLEARLIILGGEALDFASLKPWFDRHGDQRPQLINMYGITESTVHVTCKVIKEADLTRSGPSLIGAPIPDLELYVLDSHRKLVPIGVPGELYVGGAGLARGYLNRDELTAERFVGHRFDDGKVRRLYRSGDLARRRINGDIEYLGRIDQQVKVRGYRIELGEIEAMLAQHPGIQQAAVLAREDPPGDKRLVAYVIAATGSAVPAPALRNFLELKLPEYMVPSAFVFLDFLPLTPNGKIDRQALPKPDQQQSVPEQDYIAPRTKYENIVTRIWAEVLRLPRVGAGDNFFDLGGHSLLATQVVSRIREALGVELALRTLFEKPRVANLCDHLETIRLSGERDHFTEIDDMTETEDVIV